MLRLALALLLAAPAFAQDGPNPLAMTAEQASPADFIFAGEDILAKRFPTGDETGPTFARGARLEVLFDAGDTIRVRQGSRYGWIPKASTMREDPTTASDLMNDPSMQELMKKLQQAAPPAEGEGE